MKRVLFVLSVALLAGLSAQAQKTNAAPVKEKKNVGTVLSNIWKKTRDGVAGTATDLADKLTRWAAPTICRSMIPTYTRKPTE